MLQNINTKQMERISIIKKWLERQDLQLLETAMQSQQGACNEEEGLLVILNNTFRPKINETIKSQQFCQLVRQHNESEDERRVDGQAKNSSHRMQLQRSK